MEYVYDVWDFWVFLYLFLFLLYHCGYPNCVTMSRRYLLFWLTNKAFYDGAFYKPLPPAVSFSLFLSSIPFLLLLLLLSGILPGNIGATARGDIRRVVRLV